MKILCLTPWFPSHPHDQAGNFILDSIDSLMNIGHEITTLVTQPYRPSIAGFIKKEWVTKNIVIQHFPAHFNLKITKHLSIPRSFLRPVSNFFYRKQVGSVLEMLIKKNNFELIHAHTELSGLVAVDISRKTGIPTVVTLHGISTDKKLYYPSCQKILFEYTLNYANRVVLVGESLLPFFKKFVTHDDHFRIVYNGFRMNLQNLAVSRKNWPTTLRFISVSNLHDGKGIDLNLHALSKLKKNGIHNWTYKIIGDGSERKKLEKLMYSLRLDQQVFFIGACNHNEVYKYLMNSDIFILPSYREAFGIAYLEAMSFGLLAIGVEGQGPQAFIKHEKTGLLVPPLNVDQLAVTFEKIFHSPNKMFEISEAGRNYVLHHFTWQNHAQNITKIYREALHH